MSSRRSDDGGRREHFPPGFRILNGKHEFISYGEHATIRIWPSNVASFFENHMHSAIEIILVDRGEAIYHLPDETYHVRTGEMLIVPSGMEHTLRESEDTLRYILLFEPEFLYTLRDIQHISDMLQHPIYLREQSETGRQVRALLMEAVACYAQKPPLFNARCYAILTQAYALLGEKYLQTVAEKTPARRAVIDPEIMNSAIIYIGEHYMDPISLDDVAGFVGFSKYYFSRTFKEFAGISFSAYLLMTRLNAAVSQLVQTNLPIRDIAVSCGFGCVATFNRVFRESKNCTPTQFRTIYGMRSGSGALRPLP